VTARFADRSAAGRELAERLATSLPSAGNLLVLGLPRGGVPVAAEVASALGAPLDVFVVRKLGLPGQEELAMGAVASGGLRVLNEDLLARIRISAALLERVAAAEELEVVRREASYRGGRPPVDVGGRVVVLVDDGLATGSTMRAAVGTLRQRAPARIVVGVPTASASAVETLAREADEVVCLVTPEPFYAVGMSYDDFDEVTDDEVRALLSSPGS
jgi:predicted phosphoribosyltransferase